MILYFSFLTIVLCMVLLLFSAQINRSVLYLIGYLVSIALYGILHHLIFFNSSGVKLAIINIHLIPVYYLAGPMLFFYVRGTLKDSNRLSVKDLIHFMPSTISLFAILPYIPLDFDYKTQIAQLFIDHPDSIKSVTTHILYPNYINVILRPILLLSYSIGCMHMLWKYSTKQKKSSPHLQKKWMVNWLFTISTTSVLAGLSYLLMTYSFFTTPNLKSEVFNQLPISIFTGIVFTAIPAIIIFFPKILYGIPKNYPKNSIALLKEKKMERGNPDDPFMETAARIQAFIEQEKPYLNPSFTVQSICTFLDIPKHHVYYCLNNIIKQKFTDLRNRYRIDYAKKLLLSGKVNKITIEGIGIESGFASKSHFFAVFKELTGLSPIEFLEQNKSISETTDKKG